MKAIARQWALTLIALLAAATADSKTWYDYRDKSWDHTKGGDFWNEELVITTPEQLAQLAWLVNEEGVTFSQKTIQLKADINLNKTVDGERVLWIPIGIKSAVFEGSFVGHKYVGGELASNYTISGMYINTPSLESPARTYVGLFGHCKGFIGYVTLDSPEVVFTRSNGYWTNIGTLCGMLDGHSTLVQRARSQSFVNVPCGIRGVTVKDAKVTVNGTSYGALGGIVGLCKGFGVSHSTMTGTITANTIITTGGVAGILESYSESTTPSKPAVTDCTVQATIIGKADLSVGGIVGNTKSGTVVNACAAMGSVTSEKGHAGGVVGHQEAGSTVSGCASTVSLTAKENVGGIVGIMSKADSGTSMIEHCAYSGHIDASAATYAGGICGKMEWEKNEHLTGCLFLGTMSMPAKKENCSATTGNNPKPEETVSMCYYDRCLFGGKVANGMDSHVTCQGLTTAQLTSGDISDVPFLKISSGDVGFTLAKGFYPAVYSSAEWTGYTVMHNGSNDNFSALFCHRRPQNTNYQLGAWLCSLPISMGRGDVAYDFVSTVTAIPFSSSLTLDDGRDVKLSGKTVLPESSAIKLSGTTAKAVGSGTGKISISTGYQSEVTYHDRPLLVNGRKQLLLNAALGKPWDGSVATALDFGSGTAEDPFIVRNGAQLAYAVLNNQEGQFYEQLCDIVLNVGLQGKNGADGSTNPKPWVKPTTWAGHYDGAGHIVYGVYLRSDYTSCFGDVAVNGEIANVGIAQSIIERGGSGLLARNVDGHVYNCFVQGMSGIIMPSTSIKSQDYGVSRAGGICSTVGLHNAGAVVEDCISAYFNRYAFSDYTPFVSLNDDNRGVVRNCLSVVPTFFASTDWTTTDFSASGHNYISDCYWLKGYEQGDTGQTLDEIGQALSRRACWQWERGYFPTLKSFAETDIAKLMMLPVRTDKGAELSGGNYLLGFDRQQEFEPGGAQWELVDNASFYIDADGDMGIITPQKASLDASYMTPPTARGILGLVFVKATYGSASLYIPMRTMSYDVSQGITFVDDNARQACLQAFDTDGNGWLSLAEVKAVTAEKAMTAFQTPTARNIRLFPELRFFKGITELTTQLNGLSRLEEVMLPYALQTLGTEAFKGCDQLMSVTIPAKLGEVRPRAFYGSSVDSIFVDAFNKQFVDRDGILFTADNRLVAFPNGRVGEECTVRGTVSGIADGAFYKVVRLRRLYFDTTDYTTVPQLSAESLVTDDGSMLDVYVSDATQDQSLMAAYRKSTSWTAYEAAGKLHMYFPLKIEDRLATTDATGQRCYVSTMCLGFDTELPDALTPYTVELADREHYKAYLTEKSRRVPATAAVVIYAAKPGLYRLSPLAEKLAPWPLYENRLVGTDRDGLPLNQSTSAQGSIMTPAYSADGTVVGFYHDRTKQVEPYKAYLPYNTVGMDKDIARNAHYDVIYTWQREQRVAVGDFVFDVYRKQTDQSGKAVLATYTGEGHHVVVPATITAANTQYDVVQVASRAFADKKLWTLDMSALKKMEPVVTDRTVKDSPLSAVDSTTIVYLPEGKGKPADNVVVGSECGKLRLIDGRDFQPLVEFSATSAVLDREFAADRSGDVWRSRAYTVSLPFDAECPAGATLYRLKAISEGSRLAVFSPVDDNNITAGEPYLMVVREGSFRLSATDAYIVPLTAKAAPVGAWPSAGDKPIAQWQSTAANADAATAARQQMYVLQDDGTFKLVLSDYPEATVSPFRAVFTPKEKLERMIYIVALEKGSTAELLGAASYTADAVMPNYSRFDTDRVPAAVWTAANKRLTFATLPYTTKAGDSYGGKTVTALWRDEAVTSSGNKAPQWTDGAYAHEATSVVFDPSFADCQPTSTHGWFKDMTKLTVIDLSDADFIRATDVSEMFAGCSGLTTIFTKDTSPLPFDASGDDVFKGCVKLKNYTPGNNDVNYANPHYGYLTFRPCVFWCEDTETLHFAAPDHPYEVGDSYKGGTIKQMWSGLQVYDVGWTIPGWNSVKQSVKHVVFDRSFAEQRPQSLYSWFARFSAIEGIDGLEYLNTSETTNFNSTFLSCRQLKTLYLNTFDMSRANNATTMFRQCDALATIYCDKTWDIKTASGMFLACTSLKGAASYQRENVESTMANPATGYFTRVPVVEFIDLADNSEKLQRYDRQYVHAKCNRTFSAIQNADGTWTSKAYTVCLPFGIDVFKQVGNNDDVQVYYLSSVTKANEFIFCQARYRDSQWGDNIMLPGEPYVVVVNKGTFKLEANDALITSTPIDMNVMKQVSDNDNDYEVGGYWKGTFAIISNDDATAMKAHTMSNDGKFRRISNDEERYRIAKVGTFRAFYSSIADDGFPSYTPKFEPDTQGDNELEEGAIRTFPADTYDGDDVSMYPTAVRPVIHTIDGDDTHRYFDLLGRPLTTPPANGVFIDNGTKRMNKK